MKTLMDRSRMLARLSASARGLPGESSDWYRITNAAGDNGDTAEVCIYAEIGWFGVTAQDFMAELRSITAPKINLRMSSPGGEIFDGIAIMNLLRSHPATVTAYIDSLAASIASVIVMAADKVVMQPFSQMMIHDASGGSWGNAADMREMADLLDRQSDNIAAVYAERAGGQARSWRNRMKEETWYTADEAVAAGLADEVAPTARRPTSGDGSGAGSGETDRVDLSVYAFAGLFRYAGRDYAPPPDLSNPPPAGHQARTKTADLTDTAAAAEDTGEDETDSSVAGEEAGQAEAPDGDTDTATGEALPDPQPDPPPAPPAPAAGDEDTTGAAGDETEESAETDTEPAGDPPVVTGGEWEAAVAHLAAPPGDWLGLVAHLTEPRRTARRHRTNA